MKKYGIFGKCNKKARVFFEKLGFLKNRSFTYEMHSFIRVVHDNRSPPLLLSWTSLMTSCIAWGREKRVVVLRGVGKNAWNTRGFIAPNPRKVRGVHALRGNAPNCRAITTGSLKGSSTSFCLIDMVNNCLRTLDTPSHYLRVCFLDFSKAFDRINHNILIGKLILLGSVTSFLIAVN